jgi:hypothetical protein
MRIKSLRALLILVSLASINLALADQKIKTKSNIKNDRVQQPTTNVDCPNKEESADCVKPEEVKSDTKDATETDIKKTEPVSNE